MDLSIIILNYRQRELVKQCLRGVMLAQPRCAYEVIVVDNDSRDGCLEMVARLFPWAARVASPKNRGFGAGNNLGIQHASGEYCLILNPDIALFAGQVDGLLEFLRSHANVAVAGPRLLYPDGSTQESGRRFPRWHIPAFRRTMLGRLPVGRRLLDHFLMRDMDLTVSQPVDWLMGACLMLRRQTFTVLGGFDERYFLYFEDLDLCRRVWQAGGEVWYVTTVRPVHYHARSSAAVPLLLSPGNANARHHLASWLRYVLKYRGQALPPGSPSGQAQRRGVK